MKVQTSISLESKEIKALIAKALDIPVECVVSTHYGFGIQNVSEIKLTEKFEKLGIKATE